MLSKKWILLASSMLVLTAAQYVEGIGIQIGPFELFLRGGVRADRVLVWDNPICNAIDRHKQVEMVVELEERNNGQSTRMITKRITVEPYLLGIDRQGQPVLRGNVVDEKILREITIKYGENERTNTNNGKEKKEGFFTGLFRVRGGVESVDIQRVSDVRVLEETHFDPPRNINKDRDLDRDIVELICRISA